MGFLEFLIEWFLFDSIELGSLPSCHTYSDIDKTFRTKSGRLQTENAVTMDDLQNLQNPEMKYIGLDPLHFIGNYPALWRQSVVAGKTNMRDPWRIRELLSFPGAR